MNLDTQSLQPIINFIWSVADDVLINKYLENQYQDVILPMTVLRRLDLALEESKEQVLKTFNEFKGKIDDLSGLLTSKEHGSNLAFYNTSQYTMKKLLDDPKNIDANFARITSDKVAQEELLKHVTTNFDFYKLITDNKDAKEDFNAMMFGMVKDIIKKGLNGGQFCKS